MSLIRSINPFLIVLFSKSEIHMRIYNCKLTGLWISDHEIQR